MQKTTEITVVTLAKAFFVSLIVDPLLYVSLWDIAFFFRIWKKNRFENRHGDNKVVLSNPSQLMSLFDTKEKKVW